jgi:hypothetical protein
VAAPGAVTLSWAPVAGAASYQVWRSLVSGGGFTLVGETTDAGFVDDRVPNGSLAYHVVTALDAAGNVSARSPEVVSLPQHTITAVEATGPATRAVPLSLTGPGVVVTGSVTLDGATSTDATSGVRVEVGVGPTDTSPDVASWTWSRATPDAGTPDTWTGAVRPDTTGTFATAVRASTDGGRTWTVSGTDRTIEMLPDADPGAPAAPTGVAVLDVAADHVTLRWDADTTGDVARYLVLRGASGATPEPIATTSAPVFTDLTVVADTRYTYQVVAQDDGGDASPPSEPLDVLAEAPVVSLTFRVSVPADTPADAQLYIAGDFQGWAPGDTPMTQVDAATWSIDLVFESGTALQYKYTRGSWEAVEKDTECGEIPNRTLTVDGSLGASQTIEDVVGTWRDIAGCP